MKKVSCDSARAASAFLISLSLSCAVGRAAAQATTITCSTVAACVFAHNIGSGNGAEASSANNDGLVGKTTKSCPAGGTCASSAGVAGYDGGVTYGTNVNSGVYGFSQYGYGVQGRSARNAGIAGFSDIVGVQGTGTGSNGMGVIGSSSGAYSVGIAALASVAVFAIPILNDPNSAGVVAFAGQAGAVSANTQSGGSVVEGPALFASTSTTDGTTPLGPLFVGTNYSAGKDVVSIDASGNMILAGRLTQQGTPLFRTTNTSGQEVATFGERASSPNVEDVGEGRLLQGKAYVRLDSAFAATIDASAKYFVFITPQGDNRGLYVTAVSPQGFAVKESGNGRSSLAFDYRIVAKPLDTGSLRLTAMSAFPSLGRAQPRSAEWARMQARISGLSQKSLTRVR